MRTKNLNSTILNFARFLANPPDDFIEKCWHSTPDDIPTLKGLYRVCGNNPPLQFFLVLPPENQCKLSFWIDTQFQSDSDLHWQVLSPDKVSYGDEAEDYAGSKGLVINVCQVEDYKTMLGYDSSGWMDSKGKFISELELDRKTDWLLAVSLWDEAAGLGITAVYVYGADGAAVYR